MLRARKGTANLLSCSTTKKEKRSFDHYLSPKQLVLQTHCRALFKVVEETVVLHMEFRMSAEEFTTNSSYSG